MNTRTIEQLRADRRILPHWKFLKKVEFTRPLWILMLCELPAFAYILTGLALDWFPDRRSAAVHPALDIHAWVALFLLFGGMIAGILFARDPRRRLLKERLLCYACGTYRVAGEDVCRSCHVSFKLQDDHHRAVREFSASHTLLDGRLPETKVRREWRALNTEYWRILPRIVLALLPAVTWGGVVLLLDPEHAPDSRQQVLWPLMSISGLFLIAHLFWRLHKLSLLRPETKFANRCLQCGTTRSGGIERCWKCGGDFAPQDARLLPLLDNLASRGRVKWPLIDRKLCRNLLIAAMPAVIVLFLFACVVLPSSILSDAVQRDQVLLDFGVWMESHIAYKVLVVLVMTGAAILLALIIVRYSASIHGRQRRALFQEFEGRCLFCGHALPAGTTVDSEGRCSSCDAGLDRIERWRAQLHASIQNSPHAARR